MPIRTEKWHVYKFTLAGAATEQYGGDTMSEPVTAPTSLWSARSVSVSPVEKAASLSVDFTPADRSIHHVRLMTMSFVQLAVADHPFASRVTVTCAELADVVGRRLGLGCSLKLQVYPAALKVKVEVSGEGSEVESQALERAIALTNEGAPLDAYTRALTASGDSELLLGLARIRYEAQLKLSARRTGRRLTLIAESL